MCIMRDHYYDAVHYDEKNVAMLNGRSHWTVDPFSRGSAYSLRTVGHMTSIIT